MHAAVMSNLEIHYHKHEDSYSFPRILPISPSSENQHSSRKSSTLRNVKTTHSLLIFYILPLSLPTLPPLPIHTPPSPPKPQPTPSSFQFNSSLGLVRRRYYRLRAPIIIITTNLILSHLAVTTKSGPILLF